MRTALLVLAVVGSTTAALGMEGLAESGTVVGTVVAQGARSSADVVVSLQTPGVTATAPKQPIEMDQKGMLFIPRVLAVVKGTTVRFLNSDATPHNVFSPQGKYNLGTWPKGETREYKFDKPGVYTQLCRVHPEMEAFVVVLETPYFATTDSAGRFAIKDVPSGKYAVVTWGNRLKKAEQAIVVETGKEVSVALTLTR